MQFRAAVAVALALGLFTESSMLEARPTSVYVSYEGELRIGFEYGRFFPSGSEQGLIPRFESKEAQASFKQMMTGLDRNQTHCFRVKLDGRAANGTGELDLHFFQIKRIEAQEATQCPPGI